MSQQKRQRREGDDNKTSTSAVNSFMDTTIDDGNGNEPLVKELKQKLAAAEVTKSHVWEYV
jgi:hypothetical protein